MTSTNTIRGVLKRDHDTCVIRGPFCTVHATVADHRANRGAGGSRMLDDPSNLIAACELCNGWKEDTTGRDRLRLERRGIRLPKRATNAQTLQLAMSVPVKYPDGVWRLLDPFYGAEPVSDNEAAEILTAFGISIDLEGLVA